MDIIIWGLNAIFSLFLWWSKIYHYKEVLLTKGATPWFRHWIGTIYEFIVRDPRSEQIYDCLIQLTRQLEIAEFTYDLPKCYNDFPLGLELGTQQSNPMEIIQWRLYYIRSILIIGCFCCSVVFQDSVAEFSPIRLYFSIEHMIVRAAFLAFRVVPLFNISKIKSKIGWNLIRIL